MLSDIILDETPGYPVDPSAPPAAGTPPAPTTPAPPPYDPMKDRSKPPQKRPGFLWEWDETQGRWVEYSDPNDPINQRPPGERNPAPTNPYDPSAAAGDAPVLGFPDYESSGPFIPGYEDPGPFRPRSMDFEYEPFSYDPYTPTTWDDAAKEPGFAAAQDRLRKQVEAGAAYRGMVRSGMTLENLGTALDSNRQQNFQQFDARRFRNWDSNRSAALEQWAGNLNAKAQKFGLELGVDKDIYDRKLEVGRDKYGVSRDVFDRFATDVDRKNNFRFNVASEQFKDALARWQAKIDSMTRIVTAGAQS